MAINSFSRAGFCLLACLLALLTSPAAIAQESFEGNWKIVEVTRPDWIEPTAVPQEKPMTVADQIQITPGAIDANGILECANASYRIVMVSQTALFQESINGPTKAASVASQFGLDGSPRSLKVDCNNGTTFDFHEARNGRIVTLVDSLVYTLERTR